MPTPSTSQHVSPRRQPPLMPQMFPMQVASVQISGTAGQSAGVAHSTHVLLVGSVASKQTGAPVGQLDGPPSQQGAHEPPCSGQQSSPSGQPPSVISHVPETQATTVQMLGDMQVSSVVHDSPRARSAADAR